MTQKEMTEIFGIMLLAYPNAEIFKGGIQKLAPTINLWCTCLPDVDFWVGQQAVIKLCRECKYPPTIAEFKEKADAVKFELRRKIDSAWDILRKPIKLQGATPVEAYNCAPEHIRAVVDAMGGADKLVIMRVRTMGDGSQRPYEDLNRDAFRQTYEKMLRSQTSRKGEPNSMIGGSAKQIGGKLK